LLQRASEALVVFATDGAPPRYGFERRFGSLQRYSAARFQEAEKALKALPHASFQRLSAQDGGCFVDQHLFLSLSKSFKSLCQLAHAFSPDLLVSHAFEGGHIDHDACHVLAWQAGRTLKLRCLEFPLYWRSPDGKDVFQQFRDDGDEEFTLDLSPGELLLKRQMLDSYATQRVVTSVFEPNAERFRPMAAADGVKPAWHGYPFENRWRPLKAGLFIAKVEEFRRSLRMEDGCRWRCSPWTRA
jgi:N-acetylglucosamine malate deacetylase 2